MEPQIHTCGSVHLTDSWTLSKTVHFGRLPFSKETVDYQLKPEDADRSDDRFPDEDLDAAEPTWGPHTDKRPQRSCSKCHGGRE